MIQVRVVIVDDEPLARVRLKRLLSLLPKIKIVAECGSGSELIEFLSNSEVDALFLDVQMPGEDAFSILEQIPTPRPDIVFVTAYNSHAVRAFEVEATDYLVKPISLDRLRLATERLKPKTAIENPPVISLATGFTTRLDLQAAGETLHIETASVQCLCVKEDHVEIQTESRNYLYPGTLDSIESLLDPSAFSRIDETSIVRIDAVTLVEPLVSGIFKLLLRNGNYVCSGQSYARQVKKVFGLGPDNTANKEKVEAKPANTNILSERETQVLKWTAIGKTSWEISSILEISERTVNFHLGNIANKLGVSGRRAACSLAIARGLIRL
jgi:two-component system, LytTR family, response regulator